MRDNNPSSTVGTLSAAWLRLAWVFFFACAMGLLEAICVIYLRRLIKPSDMASSPMPIPLGWHVEPIREACTMVMLLATAWLAGANVRSRLAAFFVIFGVWDILYYGGLKWLANWPSAWLQWDCLFLIPKPWFGPVLAPILISVYFIVVCGWVFLREESGRRLRISPLALALQLPGLCLWYWSFVKDSERIKAHGYDGIVYSWPLFLCGLGVALVGLWVASRLPRKTIINNGHEQ